MSAALEALGLAPNPLRRSFLGWQCRVRQIAMRDHEGRPDDAIMPAVTLPGQDEPLGHVITVLNKVPGRDSVSEMEHMAAKTNDPAQVREAAIRFLSSSYYQEPASFSDILTATFPPDSPGAATIRAAERVQLTYQAYAQRYDLSCKVWKLAPKNPLRRATLAHNRLFNPAMREGTVVLGFEPDWSRSTGS